MSIYRSPYEAYPFLSDADEDLRCDFEIFTDRMASGTGLLAALCPEFREELLQVAAVIYHLNPTLRTFFSVTPEEMQWLQTVSLHHREATLGRCEKFVLPCGSERACQAHLLRTEGKQLVRMLYRYLSRGGNELPAAIDLANLLSGYFFYLALDLNRLDGVDEIPFISRNYR